MLMQLTAGLGNVRSANHFNVDRGHIQHIHGIFICVEIFFLLLKIQSKYLFLNKCFITFGSLIRWIQNLPLVCEKKYLTLIMAYILFITKFIDASPNFQWMITKTFI